MIRPSRATWIALGVALLYAALSLCRSFHHVMWADEWSVWLASSRAASAWDVVQSVRYDGHPPIWYLLLHALSRISADPAIAKVAHGVIASTSIFIIWRYGPFSLVEKLLLPLGYFFFFEYSTITRSYAPAVMLSLIAAAMFSRGVRLPAPYAILLLLIGQWSVYGMILSLALAAGVASQWRHERPRGWKMAAAVMVTSLVLFYLSTRASADGTGQTLWMNDWRHLSPAKALASLFDAYVPLPKITNHWWNTQMIGLPDEVRGILAIAMLSAAVWSCRTPAARAILLAGTTLVIATVLLIYTGYMRHWGHCFIVLVLALWVERQLSGPRRGRLVGHTFAALLAVQAMAGVMAAALDWRQPFSAAPEAARAIERLAPGLPIAGDFDYALVSLAGNLHRPVWFIRSNRADWTVRYDVHRKQNVTLKMIEDQVRELAEREHSDVLLVMTYAVGLPRYFEPVAEIAPATVAEEGYLIYRYRLSTQAPNE